MSNLKQFVKDNIFIDTTSLIYYMFDQNLCGEDDIINVAKLKEYVPIEPYFEDIDEVVAYYIISDWLADLLRARGEAVLQVSSNFWWARTTRGAIEDDAVILDIYKHVMGASNDN